MRIPIVLDRFESVADWTVIGNDTDNLAVSTTLPPFGAYSVEFDKVNGAGNTIFAGAYRAFSPALDLKNEDIQPFDRIMWSFHASVLTDIVYAFVHLGSSASNYNEWRYLVASMTAARWNTCYAEIGDAYVGGLGWDWGNVAYAEFGVAFSAQDKTLADMRVSRLLLQPVDISKA